VVLGEDAAGDVGADRDAVDALEQAVARVVVDEVELAAGATGVAKLAARAVVEGPFGLADDAAGCVPAVGDVPTVSWLDVRWTERAPAVSLIESGRPEAV
jgi:hypothetical protein